MPKNAALAVAIAGAILCTPTIKLWLAEEAAKTSTPIDDWMLTTLYSFLPCPEKEA